MNFKNKALFASAGTGKTFQLTNRFIQILHHTEKPDRIIALTFTRAAAGEFFKKIIEKLYTAATSESKAVELSEMLNIDADSKRYAYLIECMLNNLNKQNLQTLDSFLYKITAAFTSELGIPQSLNLLSESTAKHYQKLIRDGLIHKLDHSAQGKALIKNFWQAFKQSNYGEQKRSIEKTLSTYIEDQYQLYLDAPDARQWGQLNSIWDSSLPWFTHENFDWTKLSENIVRAIPEKCEGSELSAYLTAAKDIQSFPKTLKYNTTLSRCIQNHEALFSGEARIRVQKEDLVIKGAMCKALSEGVQAIFSYHVKRALECTQGNFKILEIYDRAYDQTVRKKGQLTFTDLICLLDPKSKNTALNLNDPITRALIEFRLDAQYDHWLFDEFQDTSRQQWNILSNLIEEVLQDPEDRRSVYFVGDTKQSLYLWRSSDDRLYKEICTQYKDCIEQPEPLTESFRSSPAIMQAVNTVFDQPDLIAHYFGNNIRKRWENAWKPHFSNKALVNQEGFAAWIDVHQWTDYTEQDCILSILKSLEPKLETLSIGILVRKNDEVLKLAHYLREQNLKFPIQIGSSQRPAKDNSVGLTLITMLKYCIYPSDSASKKLLNLIDSSTKGSSLSRAVERLRPIANGLTASELVLAFTEAILEKIESKDSRHKDILRRLIENSRQFEAEENAKLSDLIPFLENYQCNASNTRSQITIETIHRSKGLEYDVVLLMNNDNGMPSKQRIQGRRNEKQEIEWVLAPFKKDLMQALPKVDQLYNQIIEQENYSALCKLYVGMTRSKKALYMINKLYRPNKNSVLSYLKDCLGDSCETVELFDGERFPVLWQLGDARWHLTIPTSKTAILVPESRESEPIYPPTHERLKTVNPSKLKAKTRIHSFGRSFHSTQFGEQIHEAFQQIDWYSSKAQIESILNTIPNASATKLLRECFSQKPIQDLFSKESPTSELWREKSFTYSENKILVNGTFDRVQLIRDSHGNCLKATLIDFKTDSISANQSLQSAAKKHEKQIHLYHKVLSKLLHLESHNIETVLLFTHIKKLYFFNSETMQAAD